MVRRHKPLHVKPSIRSSKHHVSNATQNFQPLFQPSIRNRRHAPRVIVVQFRRSGTRIECQMTSHVAKQGMDVYYCRAYLFYLYENKGVLATLHLKGWKFTAADVSVNEPRDSLNTATGMLFHRPSPSSTRV